MMRTFARPIGWLTPVADLALVPVAVYLATRGLHASGWLSWLAGGWLFLLLALTWRSVASLAFQLRRWRATVDADHDLVDRSDPDAAAARTLVGTLAYGELLRHMVVRNLKLKYRGSVFGFVWSLVNPLLMIVVYSAAFSVILRVRTPGFVFFLLLGVLAWTFFANSASMSTGAIVDGGGLVKSAVFPRAIMPASVVLFNLAQYLLNVVVFLPLMLVAYRVMPVGPMALFPVFLALQVVFTIGVALVLAAATVFFRDVRHILEIALSVMFWTTPIVYSLRDLPDRARTLVLMSPLSPFVAAYQQIFYERHWPDPAVWMFAALYAVAALACGLRLFVSLEDRFAEQV
jgi:lipopolysaccharide transport system permease protein